MLPESLKVQFWSDVRGRLVGTHELPPAEADRAVREYREWLDEKRIGELIYHRDSEAVADTVAAAWKADVLRPVVVR